jgi:hypothetical protein
MIKVGDIRKHVTIKNPKLRRSYKRKIFYGYQDIPYDIDGWADGKKYLPEDFDLVYMRLKREKTIVGWINDTCWNGWRLKSDDEVVSWKRKLPDRD